MKPNWPGWPLVASDLATSRKGPTMSVAVASKEAQELSETMWTEFHRLNPEMTMKSVPSMTAHIVDAAIHRERERCADIVSEARHGERDGDFRCLIHAIRNPE